MRDVRGAGRPGGPMAVRSTLPTHTPADIREVLRGLPAATGYVVTVKPLRYRKEPHLQAFTFWDHPEIVIQVPEPFRPFSELVDLGAQGKPNVLFPTRRDVIRFLYLHELCHWWLYLTHGWGGSAEIACDRYAYANYRRRGVVRPPAMRGSTATEALLACLDVLPQIRPLRRGVGVLEDVLRGPSRGAVRGVAERSARSG